MYSSCVPGSRKHRTPIETTYTRLRAHLASLFEQIITDRQVVIVRRRGGDDIALLPADELESLMETAYLLRSPANAIAVLSPSPPPVL
jgi:antitoxin YefM